MDANRVDSSIPADAPLAGPDAGSRQGGFAYAGCFTRGTEEGERTLPHGITVFAVSADTGALSAVQVVESENPSFLALHPNRRFLYAVNEITDFAGERTGSVEAYAIDPGTGQLAFLNRQDSHGLGPTHLAVAPGGTHVVVANYAGGTFALLPIREDGQLDPASDVVTQTGSGPNPDRQEGPHPHGVAFDPAGRFVATADLGIDKVQLFHIDTAMGRLVPVSEASVAPGAGPRHLAFHRNGRFLSVINEMIATITTFAYDAEQGQIGAEVQTVSTVPDDFRDDNSTAEIAVHPTGRFLYGSNREQPGATSPVASSIASFSVDQDSGMLTPIGHTGDGIAVPRNFAIDPTGTWLYVCNQAGQTITRFQINPDTGALAATGDEVEAPTPVCLVFGS